MTLRRRIANSHIASPPPADPGYLEPSVHPAAYPDPDANKYKNGDTSSWAEDPHPGPYPNTPPPADPGMDHPQGHPATDPAHYFPGSVAPSIPGLEGLEGLNPQEMRLALEKKAVKCVKVARAMLGKTASDGDVEEQALELMNLPTSRIHASLARIAKAANTTLTPGAVEAPAPVPTVEVPVLEPGAVVEDVAVAEVAKQAAAKAQRYSKMAAYWANQAKLAGGEACEPEAELEKVKEETAKTASRRRASDQNARANANWPPASEVDQEAETILASMLKEEAEKEETAKKEAAAAKEGSLKLSSDERALLNELIAERRAAKKAAGTTPPAEAPVVEAPASEEDEDEKKLAAMIAEQEKIAAGESEEPAAPAAGSELEVEMDEEDPMGLMGGEPETLSETETSALYGEPEAPAAPAKKGAASKVASAKPELHPQPRKPSVGPKTVGTVRTASAEDAEAALSSLWTSDPDVSEFFGGK